MAKPANRLDPVGLRTNALVAESRIPNSRIIRPHRRRPPEPVRSRQPARAGPPPQHPGDQPAAANAARQDAAEKMAAVYARYCWPVQSLDGVKLAPFHLLPSEGQVYLNRPHRWHLAAANQLAPKTRN